MTLSNHICRIVVFLILTSLVTFGLSAVAEPTPTAAGPRAPIVLTGDRTASQSENTLLLANGGKALQKIVIAETAAPYIKETAAYLAATLEKITGAKFEIVTGDGSGGIVLGTIADFPVTALQKPLGIRPVLDGVTLRNGVEAYGIRTEAKRLLLLGGGNAGVSHAVARFLELLGYRRFYPAAEWEIVPALPKLTFNRNETDRPAILARHIWHAFGLPSDPAIIDETPEDRMLRAKTDIPAWYRQNRLGESFKVQASHTWQAIYLANKEAYEAHPEYWGTYKGKRYKGLVCVSNPAVRAMMVKLALDYFEKHPEADMRSMERNDGDWICECEACQALGDDSARLFGLANEVAKAVRQKYPCKMIGVLAYNTHDVPPKFDMEPNVHVQVARLFIRSGNTFRQLVEMWSRKTSNIGIYDYFSTYQWGQDRLRRRTGAGPTADLALLRSDIAFVAQQGALSLWSESSVAWGAHGRGNLVATRLMWNPDADVDAILADFYEKAFGPAAPAMKRYFDHVDGENESITVAFLARAFEYVNEAAKLAKDRPDVQARLDHIKQFLYYNELMFRLMATKDATEKKGLTLQKLTHEFRTRYSYMTHWCAVSNYLADAAKTFSEPGWALPGWKEIAKLKKEGATIPAPPWLAEKSYIPDGTKQRSLPGYATIELKYVRKPYTHEETERKFQEGLTYFTQQTNNLSSQSP